MKFILVAITILFGWLQVHASNFHEHLLSLPTPEDILSVSEAILELPEKQQQLSKIFQTSSDVERFLSFKWGKDKTEAFLKEDGFNKTLSQLCKALDSNPKMGLAKLLAFDVDESTPMRQRQLLYIDLEDLRKAIFFALTAEDVEAIFAHYFEHEPLVERRVISATVTRRFFARDQEDKHGKLKALAEKYGTQLVYRVSLQRQTFLKEGIALGKETFDLLEQGEIGGIDLVGSLNEKRYTYQSSVEEIEARLYALFDYISERSLVLVLHVFEASSEGPFYTAFENVVRSYTKPLQLEIGHIAHLTSYWIQVFSSNPSLKVLFHVNVSSNQFLHNCAISHLQKTVQQLLDTGFAVVPGSDGRGILPNSTYSKQSHLLGCCLHEKSFLSDADATKSLESTRTHNFNVGFHQTE